MNMKKTSLISLLLINFNFLSACSPAMEVYDTASSAILTRMAALGFIGKDHCLAREDIRLARHLEFQLGACKFSDQTEVNESVYLDCVQEPFETFSKIKGDSCIEKYIPDLIETQNAAIMHHIQKVFSAKDASATATPVPDHSPTPPTSLNPREDQTLALISGKESRLKSLIKHLNIWDADLNQYIISNASKSLLLPKLGQTDIRRKPDDLVASISHDIVDRFWGGLSELMRNQEAKNVLLSQANGTADPSSLNIFSDTLQSYAKINEITIQNKLSPIFFFPLLERELSDFYIRMKFFSTIEDFHCDLTQCAQHGPGRVQDPGKLKQLQQIYHIVGLLNQPLDENTEASVLADLHSMETSSDDSAAIRRFLSSFWLPHDSFQLEQTALLERLSDPSETQRAAVHQKILTEMDPSQIKPFAKDYVKLIGEFSNHSKLGSETGYFLGENEPVLNIGLTDDQMNQVSTHLVEIVRDLDTANTRFQAKREDYINNQIRNNDLNIQKSQLKTEILNNAFDLVNLRADIKGHQESLRHDRENSYRDYLSQIFNSANWRTRNAQGLVPVSTKVITVAGSDAPKDLMNPQIESYAINKDGFNILHALKGDLIRLNVTGKWSPACAIRKSRYASLAMSNGIGPEGYALQISDTEANVVSISDYQNSREFTSHTKTSADTYSHEQFAQISATMSYGFCNPLSPFQASIQASAGMRTAHTHSDTVSDSSGNEFSTGRDHSTTRSSDNRVAASFEMGIRLSDTPFPQLPAGSLLLFSVPEDLELSAKKTNVQVVSPYMTYLAEHNSKVFLVVNDCKEDNRQSLSVEIKHERSRDVEAHKLAEAMIQEVNKLKEEEKNILETGSLTPFTSQRLVNAARAGLATNGYTEDQEPLLEPIFKSWIFNEVHQIETKVNILQKTRQIEPLLRKISQQLSNYELLDRNQQLVKVSRQWIFEDLDIANSRQLIERSLYLMKNQTLPLLRVRLPHLYNEFREKFASSFTVDSINEDIHSLVRKFRDANDFLKNQIGIQAGTVARDLKYLAISFPRVNLESNKFMKPFRTITVPYASKFLVYQPYNILESLTAVEIDEDTAFTDIEHLQGDLTAKSYFVIRPEDLYVKDKAKLVRKFATGSLGCQEILPVVKNLGLYIELDHNSIDERQIDTLNRQRKVVPVRLVSKSEFITEDQSFSYTINSNWQLTNASVLFGANDLGVDTYAKAENGNLRRPKWGISPFGTFEVDLSALDFHSDPLALEKEKIHNIQFVFEVDLMHVAIPHTASPCRG